MAGKTRVHELAKELGVAPKVITDQLDGMGFKDLTSASAIEDSVLPALRTALEEKAAAFVQKEDERRESERTASLKARVEAAKAVAAKAARALTRKPADPLKPKTDRSKSTVKMVKAAKATPTFVTAKAKPAPTTPWPKTEERPVKLPIRSPIAPPIAPDVVPRPFEPGMVPLPAAEGAVAPAATLRPLAPPPPSQAPATRVSLGQPAEATAVGQGTAVAPSRPPAPGAPVARPGTPPVVVSPAAPASTVRGTPVKEVPRPVDRAVARPATDGDAKAVPLKPQRSEIAAAAGPSPEGLADAQAVVPAAPAAALLHEAAVADQAPAEREVLRLPESVTVAELAERMRKKGGEVIRELVSMGVMVSINQLLDVDKVKAVASRLGFNVEVRSPDGKELFEDELDPSQLKPRPPVVTVMGHVDHGKTSLLDAIRKTKVTEQEFGGITQHIGAYQVETSHGKVTFLDTPGHEAFTAMRARGAQATDIVILVVAADDGVMPQTVEAVNHAKAANVPIIVAVNKIDKGDANPDRVKQELSNLGLVPEDWGGQTIFVPTSAKKGTGVETLLEMTGLQAEIMELKANPDRAARGVVVEAKLDRGRGPVATVLIQQGTLREGDAVVAGHYHGKVRAMFNDRRQRVKSAGPVDPVEVLGLSGVPAAGDTLLAVDDERKARQIALQRREQEKKVAVSARVTLADLHKQIEAGEVKELRVILKGDVHGSLEALQEALERLSTDEVKVRVIHGAVGTITETDVMLASASNAIIIGFNVKPEPKTLQQAQIERVDIKSYNVIYEAINDVKAALEGMLAPIIRELPLGKAQVRALFGIKNVGNIAGCFVSEGKITRVGKVRVLRGSQVIGEGTVASLKRFKDDAREVLQGQDCGIGVDGVTDVRVGDVLEVFTTEEVARTL